MKDANLCERRRKQAPCALWVHWVCLWDLCEFGGAQRVFIKVESAEGGEEESLTGGNLETIATPVWSSECWESFGEIFLKMEREAWKTTFLCLILFTLSESL